MFLVPAGIPCQVTHLEKNMGPIEHITRKENLFEKYEVVFDPLFNLAPAMGDLYGFERDGYTLYVDQKNVQYID